jgi:hypothetical protein
VQPARRRGKRRHWIAHCPLPWWARRYAIWLAQHPHAELTRAPGNGYRWRYPVNAERVAEASQLAGRRIFPYWVRILEQRRDFHRYFERLQSNPSFLAREILHPEIPKGLQARQGALVWAMRKVEDGTATRRDYRTIEQLTRWVLELAYRPPKPRRQPSPIVIHLAQQPRSESDNTRTPEEPLDVEAEEIEG